MNAQHTHTHAHTDNAKLGVYDRQNFASSVATALRGRVCVCVCVLEE